MELGVRTVVLPMVNENVRGELYLRVKCISVVNMTLFSECVVQGSS